MKILIDFLPIVLFFFAYKISGIYAATAVAIVVSLILVGITWYKNRRLEMIQLVTLFTIVILGGATLIFHNEMFIKWKPTVINWVLAVLFLGSQYVGDKPLIQRLMQHAVELPTQIWHKVNASWVTFFTLIGFANIFVAYKFTTNTWVNFKLFGVLGLTIVFVVAQAIYLTKHLQQKHQSFSHKQISGD